MASKDVRAINRPGAREPIVRVAARLFRERGFADTSMQEIAEAVGLSRPALYHHFRSKTDILAALVEDVTLHSARETERIAAQAQGGDPREVLRNMVRAHASAILAKPELFAVLLREERHLPPQLRDLQQSGKRDLLDRFAGILRAGVETGVFRSLDPAFTALCIFGMCNWTIEWYRPDGRVGEEDAAARIADLCMAMVQRPVAGDNDRPDDPAAWLSILRDDIAHLERSLRRPAPTVIGKGRS